MNVIQVLYTETKDGDLQTLDVVGVFQTDKEAARCIKENFDDEIDEITDGMTDRERADYLAEEVATEFSSCHAHITREGHEMLWETKLVRIPDSFFTK